MNIDITDFEQFKVVKLTGEVDLHNSREVKNVLLDEVDKQHHVLVDFSELDYIDSSGMATLVEAFNRSKTKQVQFHIVGAVGAPLQVLKLTKLDSVFSLLDSIEQAKG
ncbi:anti-sigma factor antagonist [Alteromonadaceae bacterium M269]|nr:anti-sigma factor antagonist [Alteromonadaceae bacterium M269]